VLQILVKKCPVNYPTYFLCGNGNLKETGTPKSRQSAQGSKAIAVLWNHHLHHSRIRQEIIHTSASGYGEVSALILMLMQLWPSSAATDGDLKGGVGDVEARVLPLLVLLAIVRRKIAPVSLSGDRQVAIEKS
jgi:hypothetical protein